MRYFFTIAYFSLMTLNSFSATKVDSQIIELTVTEKGFEPSTVNAALELPVILKVTRKTDATCATEIQIPEKNINKIELPLNKTVTIKIGKLKKGIIHFGCGMKMMVGGIIYVK
jgi:plastocyanin domain-containing protein